MWRFVVTTVPALLCGCLAADLDESFATSDLTVTEGFESGTKTSYAAGSVTLGLGRWNFDDALIGTLATDIKNGARAARVRTSGQITMSFDRASVGSVSISHASYGSDGSGEWALYYSRDQGGSWTHVGSAATTAGALATTTFTVNQTGAIRLQIRKTDGGSNRIDLDDITITDVADGSDGGGGGDSGASVSVHTALGLPSSASSSDPNNFLAVKSQYVVAYNSSRKVPNWVSWRLDSSYIGSAPRSDAYRADSTLPAGMPQASLADYSGSGFDRGHMCPSGDRTRTTTANEQTFLLSNMVPQASNNNSGPWEDLENVSRALASSGRELFIVSGGIYGSSRTIGAGVSVPSSTFKVIVVLNRPGDGPSDVTTATRVIGVIVPNDNSRVSASDSWQQYRVAVRTIESQTGLDFLSDVDSDVQDVIESRIDNQ